jgi:hypothetical protein
VLQPSFAGKRTLSRDRWLALALLVALTLVLVLTAARQQRTAAPPLASFSNREDGARALRLWLEALGYAVVDAEPTVFAIPLDTRLLLILEPTTPISADEWPILDQWVQQGGTLVLAGDAYQFSSWANHYDFRRDLGRTTFSTTTVQIPYPLLVSPPLVAPPSQASGEGDGGLDSTRTDWIALAATEETPTIVTFPQGQGRVILSAAAAPFSNQGLQRAGNAQLVLNLVSLAGPPGRVWFDEWHHGVRGAATVAPVGIEQWLRATVAGRALLLAVGIIFLALVLQGRRFGRPLPLPQQHLRRTPLEYVRALANLNRRAGHRAEILQEYRLRLKRGLGRRYRLPADLPDGEFVAQLARYDPTVDQARLAHLLTELARTPVSEQQLIQLAAESTRWIKRD